MSSKKRKKKSQSKDLFFFKENPFAGMPVGQRRKMVMQIGISSGIKFREEIGKLKSLLREIDPLQAMAMLSVYGLTIGVDEEGNSQQIHRDKQFSQSHVEIVQSLYLQMSPKDISNEYPHPHTIQSLFNLLPELGMLFALQELAGVEKSRSKQEHKIELLRESLRLHTQNVRNWGYFDVVIDTVCRVFSPKDKLFAEEIGLSATQIIKLFEMIMKKTEYHLNQRLFSYSDQDLPGMLTVNTSWLANSMGLQVEPVEKIFKWLSYSFGDLSNFDTEEFFLDNPIWRRPLISMGQCNYFCPIPSLIFSFIFPIFNELAKDSAKLKKIIPECRANFLESEIAKLFSAAFPNCEILTGFKWKNADAIYENDLMIKIDSHLILVEAKSGSITWSALRGATCRMQKHIKELLLEPSIQSSRLAERMKLVLQSPGLQDSLLPGLLIKLDKVKTILRLSVTLEDFGNIQSNLHMIAGTGWLPKDHSIAPVMMLPDLKIVFETLGSIGQKLHYLKRRTEIAKDMVLTGDEMDLLGLYLRTGFSFGNAELYDTEITLLGMSDEIDQYFQAIAQGVQPKVIPHLKLTPWWQKLCAAIEYRQFYQWSDAICIMLNIPFGDQGKFEKAFTKIKKEVMISWKNPEHKSSIMIIPRGGRSDALALYAFRDEDKEMRHDRMINIGSQALDHPHVQRCLVLGFNLDRDEEPYTTLAVYNRDNGIRKTEEEFTVY